MSTVLELSAIEAYQDDRRVLHQLDFHLIHGERVAIIGANGAGKTTLLHLLVGLHSPTHGCIRIFDRDCRTEADFRHVRTRVGLLFQDSDDQLFCPTVRDDVAFGPLNLGHAPAAARAIAEQTLADLQLLHLADRSGYRLSFGEKRLVALATILAMQPQVLLLDEPTNGLDCATAARLIDYLTQLPQSMVMVTHDQALLSGLATRVLLLTDGALRASTCHAASASCRDCTKSTNGRG